MLNEAPLLPAALACISPNATELMPKSATKSSSCPSSNPQYVRRFSQRVIFAGLQLLQSLAPGVTVPGAALRSTPGLS